MTVDREEVLRIARLARLALTPEEIDRLQTDMGKILEYMAQIQTVDTSNASSELDPDRIDNVFREDSVQESLPREKALQNAPDTDGTYFRVPPVLPTREH
jgi:aspartyl-tRNA(Asn)/glutamyl-tRNA(Gln) amidotransferase subunit C